MRSACNARPALHVAGTVTLCICAWFERRGIDSRLVCRGVRRCDVCRERVATSVDRRHARPRMFQLCSQQSVCVPSHESRCRLRVYTRTDRSASACGLSVWNRGAVALVCGRASPRVAQGVCASQPFQFYVLLVFSNSLALRGPHRSPSLGLRTAAYLQLKAVCRMPCI